MSKVLRLCSAMILFLFWYIPSIDLLRDFSTSSYLNPILFVRAIERISSQPSIEKL